VSAPSRRPGRDAALSLLADIVVPVGLYYGLRAAGLSVYLTLLLASAVPAAIALIRLLRFRRIDGLAIYVLAIMLCSTGVSLISGSTRFLLAREGWLTGVTGLWFLASVRAGRPLAYLYSRPLLEHRTAASGVPGDWETLWSALPRFRRVWRVTSVMWGLGLLADSAVRVVMAYTLPVDAVPALGTALYVGTSLVLIVITNVYYTVAGLYKRDSTLYASPGPEAVGAGARR
jgi:hypothetical protein